jgi:phosphoesterase RecJ-like protein
MKMQAEMDRILSLIDNNTDFLITSHMDPDGDSIGSQLALCHALKNAGKNVAVMNQGDLPSRYRFLDPNRIIITDGRSPRFEAAVVLIIECPHMERIGSVKSIIPDSAVTVNIDHHPDNSSYADFNLVDPESSAAGEMLFLLMERGGIEITSEIAMQLYAAIVSDTGGFRFSSTTSRAMRIASDLIDRGADPKLVADGIFNAFSAETIRLLGITLAGLRLEAGGKIGYLTITRKDLENSGAELANSEGFVDFTLGISGIMMGILFKEVSQSEIKVSIRSQNGLDAASLARRFKGGGHENAAGFTGKGTMNDVIDRVLSSAREYVNA